jgi:hypothetical protein
MEEAVFLWKFVNDFLFRHADREGKMAIRLERSGGLILIHGAPDPPEKKMWWTRKPRRLGLWLVLTVFIAGVVFAAPVVSGWPVVAHTVKGLLAAAR